MIHALLLIAYTIIVWLLGSYVAWDMTWFTNIGQWQGIERFMFFIGVFITILPVVVIP